MEIKNRYFKDPEISYFLFGPRGTGKSTWLQGHYDDKALFIDLLSPHLFRHYSARPERLVELVDGNPEKELFVIDEIQKVPALLDVVHQLMENKKNLRFVLTGSSARKLKHKAVDLLAGRAANKSFHPFMASELGGDFDLLKALKIGMVPLVYASVNPLETLNAYVSLYINEEVRMEGLVRNIGDFSRFLEIISFSNGSILNMNGIARDSQVGRKAVEAYVSVLEDVLLAHKLPVFSKRAKRQLVAHPKFYFFDAGVYRALRPSGPLDSPHEIDGIALENLVLQHLMAWNAYSGNTSKLFYWRTKSGVEVDFVVYGESTLMAIEVKNSNTVKPSDLKGLRAFREDYPDVDCLFIYRGTEKLMKNGILCIPAHLFLQKLVPDKPAEQFSRFLEA
ncbi:MAG: AAA family ATPase [Bacteroidales bacterium]|nr:AAA family ATPase [Bacteroidales bacterium]